MQCCSRGSRQQCTGKSPDQFCLNTLWATMHRSKPMQCCPGGYRQHCIRKNPVQCCLSTLGTKLHRSKFYAMLSKRFQTTLHKKKTLCNVALVLLEQNCTSQNPMQCCPRGSRQHCIKNPVQCCLNTYGTTLHRSKPYAMFS